MTKEATGLIERLAAVRERISTSARRCGRSAQEITLVAVSKTHPAEMISAAIAAGVANLGENRVQEAEAKIVSLGRNAARWHLIGHLQANKARRAVTLFDVIHSVDSAALALLLDSLCEAENRALLPVFIQVDLAGEETKSGASADELEALAETIAGCGRLQLTGLMTLPPFFNDAENARPYFKRLRELRDGLKVKGCFGDRAGELSMGMTNDFEIAIEEGATMVRVGTAIFGDRKLNALTGEAGG
jgi:PLP dependent protein